MFALLALIFFISAIHVAWMIKKAPSGYEDNNGFHYGQKPSSNKEQS